jgi:FkbM family methyltransferase
MQQIKFIFFILLMVVECKIISVSGSKYQALSNLLPEQAIMLEAGAHYGEDSVRLSAIRPNGFLYCFEPTPASFIKLQHAVSGKNNVRIFPLALCDNNGLTNFHISSCNDGANTIEKPTTYYPKDCYQNNINVQCITLEQWATENHIDHIDFLWLDMEGYELTMLKAVPEKLFNSFKLILIEVNRQQFWEGIPLENEIIEWMIQKGFKSIWQEDYGLQADILFLKQ